MMPGMIMLWYGSVATIPSGWALCDGTQNTPDLCNYFIRAAGDSFVPGQVGGSTSHTHEFTGDGHSHDLPSGNEIPYTPPTGDCEHHTDTSPATGTTDSGHNVPPWYALCYIMKLPIP